LYILQFPITNNPKLPLYELALSLKANYGRVSFKDNTTLLGNLCGQAFLSLTKTFPLVSRKSQVTKPVIAKILFTKIRFVRNQTYNACTTISSTKTHDKKIEKKNFINKFMTTLRTDNIARH
jgi:hypothetical protein